MPWLDKIVAEKPILPLGATAAYSAAVLLVAAALAIRFALGSALVGVPFITFFPAALLAAALGGFGPGLLAVALSLLAVRFILLPQNFGLPGWEWSGGLAFSIFTIVAVMFAAIIEGFYRALARLRDMRRREGALMATLEQRVAERTEQLSAANEQLRIEIDERAKAEAAARQSQKMEVIGRLAGGIAHDFNNLLTVILGNIEAAQRRLGAREPDAAACIAAALRGAERAATLTHRLLAFSRQQPLDVAPVDLNGLISGMSELIHRTLGSHIAIESVLAGGLWRTLCAANQLEAALLNLVVNARDAMPAGGKLTIESANVVLDEAYAARHDEVAPGHYAMIAVTDTGAGMPPDVLERVFDPFFTTKPAGEGTGLGLSMVFGLVKQSGGHIAIYSEPEYGTTVKIYLPRLVGEYPEVEPAVPPPAAPPAGDEGCTVLVVEDEEDVRAFAVQTLVELGYRVCEAPDGPAALGILQREANVAVLFTDVGLPNTNLRQMVDEARRLHRELRVIYTTGYTRNAIVHGGILDPGVDLLPKPFTATALGRKLREALSTPVSQAGQD